MVKSTRINDGAPRTIAASRDQLRFAAFVRSLRSDRVRMSASDQRVTRISPVYDPPGGSLQRGRIYLQRGRHRGKTVAGQIGILAGIPRQLVGSEKKPTRQKASAHRAAGDGPASKS